MLVSPAGPPTRSPHGTLWIEKEWYDMWIALCRDKELAIQHLSQPIHGNITINGSIKVSLISKTFTNLTVW